MTVDVAVNLLWCTPGEVGGSEEYLVRQLTGLAELDSDVAPTLCCTPAFAGAHRDLATLFPMRSPRRLGGRRSGRIVAEHTWLARKSSGFDVVHHGGGTTPLIGPRPILLTVHDLQYLEHPQYFSPSRLRYLRFMMPRSVARASVVATPSEFVRGTVIDSVRDRPRPRRGRAPRRAEHANRARRAGTPSPRSGLTCAPCASATGWGRGRTSCIRRSPIPTRTTNC